LALAAVRDLRELRAPATEDEIADFETDLLSGFVMARASAGLVDATIRNDVGHLELIRGWFGGPLWEMQPCDADTYFGKVLRDATPSTRTGRAAALTVYFGFLELRHKVELHTLTGRIVECPLDEINRPRGSVDPQLRMPSTAEEIERLFAGWRQELATCRKFAPTARNYAVAGLAADVGLRINEARMLDLDDVRWELGRFGKLNVRYGKGSRRKGPKPRLVPLINGADRSLCWFIEDVLGLFGIEPSGRGQGSDYLDQHHPHSQSQVSILQRPPCGQQLPVRRPPLEVVCHLEVGRSAVRRGSSSLPETCGQGLEKLGRFCSRNTQTCRRGEGRSPRIAGVPRSCVGSVGDRRQMMALSA